MTHSDPIYVNLATETDDPDVTEIESLCMNCHEMGNTRLLLTKIPHYQEIILTSFECVSCGEKNNGIQSGSFQDFGAKYELRLQKIEDLSRQIIKSDYATLNIPSIEFLIPAGKGEITTVEGIIMKSVNGLEQNQVTREKNEPKLFEQIQNFIPKLKNLLKLLQPFTIILDDPSGNSYVENPVAPNADPLLVCTRYKRSQEQNETLGLQDNNEKDSDCSVSPQANVTTSDINIKDEVVKFNTLCAHCSRPSVTKMKITDVPHFKEVVIMATECEFCGHRSNEVKSGSGIEPKGRKFSLKITEPEDMARDVLKSETCSIQIPEFELDVGAGIFVGKFSTIEGLLCDVKNDLSRNPFLLGDSAIGETRERVLAIVRDIEEVLEGKRSVHIILDDPAGNSHLQNRFDPEPDPFLEVEDYERSFDQNEDLGLNDMVTENYAVPVEENSSQKFPSWNSS